MVNRTSRIGHGSSRRALSFVTLAMVCALGTSAALRPVQDPAAGSRPAAAPEAEGRTVLITGANRGLGLEFAKQYRAAGWNVIGTAREPDEAADLKAIEGVRIEQLDVADSASVTALAERLKGQPIDLLINNAGISGAGGRLENLNIDEVERVMRVNAFGPMRVTKALLPNLRAGGTAGGGGGAAAGKNRMIVSISSGLGSIAGNTRGGNYGYRESKAALNMFTRSLAAELRREGIICIVMSPGWVQTDMGGANAQLTPEESITGMRKVIEALKPEDTGKFWNHDGAEVAW